jgi:hypothetical protein
LQQFAGTEAIPNRFLANFKFLIDRERWENAFRLIHVSSFSVAGSGEGNRTYAPMAIDAVAFHAPVTPKGLFTLAGLATTLS